VLDRVAAALGARARVCKFDTDEPGATLADRLQIGGLPTLLLFAPSSNHGGGGALQAMTHAVACGDCSRACRHCVLLCAFRPTPPTTLGLVSL
jgi:hypothetical protein